MKVVTHDIPRRWLEEHKNSEAAQRDEMWEGVLHMPPMPSGMHQDFADDLREYLKRRWAKPNGGFARREANLTTPEDEEHWTRNFRIPDVVLVSADRLHIDKDDYLVGPPLVVVEVRSPGDETFEKLPFYAALGVPEVWVFDRDTRAPELRALVAGPAYDVLAPDADGWHVSPATGVGFRQTRTGKVWARVHGDDATAEELPDT